MWELPGGKNVGMRRRCDQREVTQEGAGWSADERICESCNGASFSVVSGRWGQITAAWRGRDRMQRQQRAATAVAAGAVRWVFQHPLCLPVHACLYCSRLLHERIHSTRRQKGEAKTSLVQTEKRLSTCPDLTTPSKLRSSGKGNRAVFGGTRVKRKITTAIACRVFEICV